MNLDTILRKITDGLSGNNEADIVYLQKQAEKYQNHKYGKEIMRACGRMMYELIPEEQKDGIGQLIANDAMGLEMLMKEIRFNIYEKNYDKALQLSKALVLKIEKEDLFEDDTVSEYYTFTEVFEEILFTHYHPSEKEIRRASIPYSEIYLVHGNLLFECNQIAEARAYLEKALRWNPASCTIGFEYIETFKVTGELKTYFELTKNQFEYAYRPKDVARCFRNLGYYYIEIEEYSVAAVCYYISMFYDEDNEMAQSQLYYIEQTAPTEYPKPSVELIAQYEKEYDIPRGANRDVIGLAHAYSQYTIEEDVLDAAVYFLTIFCELTDDEESWKQLYELKEKLDEAEAASDIE